jgi:hypothetical protein
MDRLLGFRTIQLCSHRVLTSKEVMVILQIGLGGSGLVRDMDNVVCSKVQQIVLLIAPAFTTAFPILETFCDNSP